MRVAGCDLGQATACFILAEATPRGLAIERSAVVNHDGAPLDAFCAWYRAERVDTCAALAVTGVYAADLGSPALRVPEDAAVEAELAHRGSDPMAVVRVGARGYSVVCRDAAGRVTALENERCSSGTGETMVKLAGRFDMDIGAADRAAAGAAAEIPITARCSVFAKSEMTHFANQGRPADALFRGYFASVARHAAGLLGRAAFTGPVSIDVSAKLVPNAMRLAALRQRGAEASLAHIGLRALGWARQHGIPIVPVLGALHVLHDPVIGAGIPDILRQEGVMALPQDCWPLRPDTAELPLIAWADSNRALRVALEAREAGDAYPLYLSSFGCGPASFIEHMFARVMEGHPHTTLESDGHGGKAGFVTRVQAFLHTARAHSGAPSPYPAEALHIFENRTRRPFGDEAQSRLVVLAMSDRFSDLCAAFYRVQGHDVRATGPVDARARANGRQDCSGKECLPYQLIWGAFRSHLEDEPPEKRAVLLQINGRGTCRNCMFPVQDQVALERHGLADRVDVRYLQPEPENRLLFATRLFGGVTAWDLLKQMYCWTGPDNPGARALYEHWVERLLALSERPLRPGERGGLVWDRWWHKLDRLPGDAARAFAALPLAPGLPSVLLTGDIFLRIDDFGSDHLIDRLHQRGLRVLLEPSNSLVEFFAHERSPEVLGLPGSTVENLATRVLLARVRRRLYRVVCPHHAWLPEPDVKAMQRRSRDVLDRHPVGEAPISLGGALHTWDQGLVDGVVLVGPWGCGPALITEAILRHQRDIPQLYVYNDGSPVDVRKLDSFAFRLGARGTRAPRGNHAGAPGGDHSGVS